MDSGDVETTNTHIIGAAVGGRLYIYTQVNETTAQAISAEFPGQEMVRVEGLTVEGPGAAWLIELDYRNFVVYPRECIPRGWDLSRVCTVMDKAHLIVCERPELVKPIRLEI